jgi:hypothetical protein
VVTLFPLVMDVIITVGWVSIEHSLYKLKAKKQFKDCLTVGNEWHIF